MERTFGIRVQLKGKKKKKKKKKEKRKKDKKIARKALENLLRVHIIKGTWRRPAFLCRRPDRSPTERVLRRSDTIIRAKGLFSRLIPRNVGEQMSWCEYEKVNFLSDDFFPKQLLDSDPTGKM